jgi:Flp pilus assembly protein TadD
LLRIGQEQLINENPEAALDAFSQAAELAPGSPTAYAGQAIALMMMDEVDTAREAIDHALTLDPMSAEARLANAIFLFRQENKVDARRELQELAHDPHVPPFVKERANQMLERLEK